MEKPKPPPPMVVQKGAWASSKEGNARVNEMGEDIGALMRVGAILLAIFIPLGGWKIIEIVLWCVQHVSIQ